MIKIIGKILFLFFFSCLNVNSLFFEVEDTERCYIDEYFSDNIVMINYRIYDLNENDEITQRILDSIIIKIINTENDQVISQHNLKRLSGKHSTTIERNSFYKICVQNIHYYNKKIRIRLIIDSDNMDEPDLSKAIKHDDVSPVHDNINKILAKAQKIVNVQSINLDYEDEHSQKHIEYSKRFINITIVQIGLILIIGIYNLISFRNFLISKNLI